MPENQRIVYWDSCVFLSYINDMPDRIPVLSALLASSGKDAIRLYTSALSKVEVSFGAVEKSGHALNPAVEQQITNLWTDPGAIVSVEFHDDIGKEATRLIRDGITQGWSLKPLDAIHLAKAQWLSLTQGYKLKNFTLTISSFTDMPLF